MLCRTLGNAAVVGFFVCVSGAAWGQVANVPTVSGSGEATLRPVPDVLRMSVLIQVTEKSVDEALSRLAERRKAVTEKLKGLEAEADSIIAARPTVTKTPTVYRAAVYPVLPVPSTVPPRPQYAPQPYTPPMSSPTQAGQYTPAVPGPPVPAPSPVKPTHPPPTPPLVSPTAPPLRPGPPAVRTSFTATTMVTADWVLGAETVEQALVAGEELKAKLTTLQVVPSTKPEGSGEQRDAASGTSPAVYSPQSVQARAPYVRPALRPPTLSPPKFLYVARISAEQRRDALKKAYAKAEAQAAELAAAAGQEIGDLQSLRGQASDRAMPPAQSYQPVVAYNCVPGNAVGVQLKEHESGAPSASEIRYSCRVTAAFRLQ